MTTADPPRGRTVRPRRHPRDDHAGPGLDVARIRTELETELARLRTWLGVAEDELSDLRHARFHDVADEAEISSGTLGVDHESAMAGTARESLRQVEHALGRIVAGTYGTCEGCQDQIDPRRLEALPKATLCLTCKQVR